MLKFFYQKVFLFRMLALNPGSALFPIFSQYLRRNAECPQVNTERNAKRRSDFSKSLRPKLTQAEGFILGVGAKMFTIAGPVIVYGVSASVVYGLIYWITTLL